MKKNKEVGSNELKLILSVVLVLLLVVSVIGVTYALFTYSKVGNVKNTITTGSITFNYIETSNGISLVDAMPISDEIGKKLKYAEQNNGYFDFNVSCRIAGTAKIQYEVYSTKEKVSNPIDDQYVKIYLTDGTNDNALSGYDNEVPTYEDLKDALSVENAKQLYFGTFNSTGTQRFRLRMWVSDKYVVPSVSEEFKIKVNVQADSK